MSKQYSKRFLSCLLALVLLLSPTVSAYADFDEETNDQQEVVEEQLPAEGEELIEDAAAPEELPDEEEVVEDSSVSDEHMGTGTIETEPVTGEVYDSPIVPGSVLVSSVDASALAVAEGTAVTFTAQVVADCEYQLYYRLRNAVTDIAISEGYMSTRSLRVTPTTAGTYYLEVTAYNKDTKVWESYARSADLTVTANGFSIDSIKVNSTNAVLGTALTFQPVLTGSGNYTYNYQVFKDNVSVSNSTNVSDPVYSFTPTEAGTYYCRVTVTDNRFGKTLSQNSAKVTVYSPLVIDSIKSSAKLAMVTTAITFTVNANGGSGAYKYSYQLKRFGVECDLKTDQASKTYTFTPIQEGDYILYVTVSDAAGNTISSNSDTLTVIKQFSVNSVTPDTLRTQVGSNIHFQASYDGAPTRFGWEVTRDGQRVYTTDDSYTDFWLDYVPTEPGSYVAKATAYVYSGVDYLASSATSSAVTVVAGLTNHGVSVDNNYVHVGDSVTFNAVVSGGETNKDFIFRIYKKGSPDVLVKELSSTSSSVSFTPDSVGTYYCDAGVKDAKHVTYLFQTSKDVEVIEALRVEGITASSTKISLGSVIKYTPIISGGTGHYRIIYCAYDPTTRYQMYDTTDMEFNFTPPKAGSFYCDVYVCDDFGEWIYARSPITTVYNNVTAATATLNAMYFTLGEEVKVSVSAVGTATAYCYRIYDNTHTLVKESFSSSTYTYKPTAVGHYSVEVLVYDGANWFPGTTNYFDVFEPFSYTTVNLSTTRAAVGETMYIGTDAKGGIPSLQYIYCVADSNAQLMSAYSTSAFASFTFPHAGNYTVTVFAADGTGKWVQRTRSGIVVTNSAPLAISDVTVDKTYANIGETINYTVTATGATNYRYDVFRNGQQMTADYSSSTSYSYTIPSSGNYVITVYASDGSSWIYKQATTVTHVSEANVLMVHAVTPDKTTAKVGETITFSTAASGNVGPIKFTYAVFLDNTQITGEYSSSPTFSFTPVKAGTYRLDAYATDSRGAYVKGSSVNVVVSPIPPVALSISVSATTLSVGDSVTVTATPSDGVAPYTYKYCLFKDGSKTDEVSSSSTTNTWTLNAAGTYRIDVYCTDTINNTTMQQSGTITVS